MYKTKAEILKAISKRSASRYASGDVLPQSDIIQTRARLSERLDDSFISQKPVFNRGNKSGEVPYIAWHDIFTLLDYLAPIYIFDCEENQVGDLFVVKATLRVICTDGEIKASALGSESLGSVDFGGCMAESSAQAIRRVAATIGLGRYLYNSPQQSKRPPVKGEISREEWLKLQAR